MFRIELASELPFYLREMLFTELFNFALYVFPHESIFRLKTKATVFLKWHIYHYYYLKILFCFILLYFILSYNIIID